MRRLHLLAKQINESETFPHFTKLSLSQNSSIGYITMRSPKDLNSLGITTLKELNQALLFFHNNESIYVIVIQSEVPNIFCVGSDVKQLSQNLNYQFALRYEPIHSHLTAFSRLRKPIIAAVNGKALGGGFELALHCDVILATEKAYFGLPQINLGLMPALSGTQAFSKIVGQKKALRHILTGEGFSANEAWRLNIAEKISSQKFALEVQAFAEKIASKALTTVIIAKKAVKQASHLGLSQGLDYQKDIIYSMLSTKANREGSNAFVNKRKPDFKGL